MSMTFATLVYGADGALVNSVTNEVVGTLSPAHFAAISRSGIPFQQQISVPATGDYSLRVGVRDAGSHRIGSIELPVAPLRALSPLSATASH